MEETFTVELTKRELQDIRIALMDYRSKWFNLYHDGLMGKKPQNFSVEGAGLVYDDVCKLQKRICTLDNIYA
jgi:benzoyl-CoA reductase/2-hydroxyglutaryl-CoA dehydratase subunit BcrC/BadD/HgdB